jgi:signal transduction histidine kinase
LFSEGIVKRFEEVYRDRDLRLAVTTTEKLPEVSVDPNLMEKMIQALLNRAAERSNPGGLVRVRVSTRRSNVWIEVMDEGFGTSSIPEDGDPEQDASSGRAQADGMSLEMVRAIVGSLGGQVWVQGKGKLGSTIALALPGIEGPNGH